MAKNKQEIIDEFKAHIDREGGPYDTWYVGISSDARERLLRGHKVREKGNWWIYEEANSNQAAREVEDYFVNTLGTDGGPGGGDETANMVYAYKKRSYTDP